LNGFIAIALPYITLLVFVVGMIYRIVVWVKTPQPGKMTLFPAPATESGTFWGVIRESLFFPGLFRGDKTLWITAWVFHASLALILVGHLRVFTPVLDRWLESWGVNVDSLSATAGGAAGIVILITGLWLIIRRLSLRRVREITTFSDFFALLLVVAIILSGNAMRFGEHFDLNVTRVYFAHLFTFSFADFQAPTAGIFWTHFLLVQLLLIYIPFSKILHFGGIFFTQSLIQKS
jgi:nitrate reductase gamma subunit